MRGWVVRVVLLRLVFLRMFRVENRVAGLEKLMSITSRRSMRLSFVSKVTVASVLMLSVASAFGTTGNVRIVTYNIQADVDGLTQANAYMEPVLEAIGNQTTAGVTRPLDILGLEETTSNSTTVAPMVSTLNAHYGVGVYAMSSTQATQQGGNTGGNGPNALIYNTTTLTLLQSWAVPGTPTSLVPPAGERIFRQVMRYEFAPVGAPASQAFYVYVSHMKSSASGTSAEVKGDRDTEAQAIRNDEASLPANASVVYMGDYNMGGTTEAGYATMTSLTSPSASGSVSQGMAVDPLNPTNVTTTWSSGNHTTAYKSMITESTQTSFSFRDDLQLMTSNVFSGTSTALGYVSGSEHAFGNDGTVTAGGDYFPGAAPAAGDFSNLKYDLSQASDHLPLVADYSFSFSTVPEPGTLLLMGGSVGLMGMRRRRAR